MSSNNSRDYSTPGKREATLRQLLKGIDDKFAASDVIRIDGQPYTKAEFRAKIAAALKPEEDCREAHAQLARACTVRKANAKPTDTLITLTKKALVSHYGASKATTLLAFGVNAPKKRRKATVAEKVDAAEKARQTRLARGTKGPKAKRAIKGTLA
jgi:hypothetical protein